MPCSSRRGRFPFYHFGLLIILVLMFGVNYLSIALTGEPLPNFDFTFIEFHWAPPAEADR